MITDGSGNSSAQTEVRHLADQGEVEQSLDAGLGLAGVLANRLFENADDEGIERSFIFFGPTRQLFVKHWWHPDLKVNDCLGHH